MSYTKISLPRQLSRSISVSNKIERWEHFW